MYFNPRFPRGKRQLRTDLSYLSVEFQSTLPAREATSQRAPLRIRTQISIHASREGSDSDAAANHSERQHFNPRFPRGKRPHHDDQGAHYQGFQSTLPAREATKGFLLLLGDFVLFQSTLPAREATLAINLFQKRPKISIHASREGSDPPALPAQNLAGYFNPRFPRGKRPGSFCPEGNSLTDFNPRFPRGKRR